MLNVTSRMGRRRVVLGGVGLLLAVLVGCVWVVPGLLDWNRYREGIAAFAGERLGRAVHIGGAVTLTLLPQPILTASDVTVDDAGDGLGLRARALRLRVALGPLLGGVIDARELTLQGADLRVPWPPPAGTLVQPSWVSGLRARVEDSRLQVGNLVLAGIDATLVTDPDTGTLSAAGAGEVGARQWQFTARLGQAGGDGAAGLDVSLDGQGALRDTGGTFSGQIGADGGLSGRVAGRGPDLSLLMPAPALPWRADGRFSAAGGLAVADELALEIGGAPARGAVALRVTPEARLDLAIAAGRLDLDAWVPALLGRGPAGLREGLPTGIDISAEAATLAGGTLRRLRGAVDLGWSGGAGTIRLRDVQAVLPGEAQVSLSGQVVSGVAPKFDGVMRVSAPDLRATLRWLERVLPAGVAGLPAGVLRTAVLSAHVTGDAGHVALSELQGTVDGGRVSGTASVRGGARLGVTAALVVERVALDAWVPGPREWVGAGPGVLAGLRSVDADVRVQVGRADFGAVGLGAVLVELQTEASRVFLRRLEAQPLGMRLAVSGQVGEGGRLADGRFELTAADLGVLRPVLAGVPGVPGWVERLLRGPGSLVVSAAGAAEALAGRVVVELGDLRAEAQPTVNLGAGRWSGAVTLHHPGAPRLLEALGVGGTAAWLGDGSFSLVGQIAVGGGRVELQGATLGAGSLRATGRMVVEGARVTGEVVAETLPLPLIYARSPDPLPLAWLQGWEAGVHLEAGEVLVGLTPVLQRGVTDVTLAAGVLTLGKASGRVAGGVVSGVVTVAAAAEPPRVSVRGEGTGLGVTGGVFETPLDVVAGQADATADLTAVGFSPAALLATLGGQARVRLRDGVVSGFDLLGAGSALGAAGAGGRDGTAEVRAALLGGNTAFSAVDAPMTVVRGVVSTEAVLSSGAGEGRLVGSLDLVGGGVDLRLTLRPAALEGGPGLGLRVTGPAGAPARVPELAELARWLAERPGP